MPDMWHAADPNLAEIPFCALDFYQKSKPGSGGPYNDTQNAKPTGAFCVVESLLPDGDGVLALRVYVCTGEEDAIVVIVA